MSKNKACCWILVIVGGGLFLCFLAFIVFVTSVAGIARIGEGVEPLDEDSYLVIKLGGYVEEYDTSPSLTLFGSGEDVTIHDVRTALERAKEDSRIKGVILRPLAVRGFSGIREMREAVRDFKQSGKPVYAYFEVGTDRDYYLASIADTIVMFPSRAGGLVMEGLGFSSTYLARTFDKVGIRFHVLHAGAYKGAYENLGRDSMSAELRQNITSLFESVYSTYTTETAADREALPLAILENEIQNGEHYLITAFEAKEKGFVDLLLDWESLKLRLKGEAEEFPGVSVSRYLNASRPSYKTTKELAVVYAQGEITYSIGRGGPFESDEGIESGNTIALLSELREDEDVAAVVLRVNSPGGSALASKLILEELKRLKAEKPVIISMGNTAASGGYFIACGGDEIIAQPTTLTGSIGVVSVFPTAQGLYEKLEAREETVELGKWAEYFRLDRDLSEEQRQTLTYVMEGIYSEFKDDVVSARKLSPDAVESVAQGKIWSGEQALEVGLVDAVGGLSEAIERARARAGLDTVEHRIRYYPEKSDIFEFLAGKISWAVKTFSADWGISLEEAKLRAAIEYLKQFYGTFDFVQVIMPVELDE